MANQNDLILSQQDNSTTPVELPASTEIVSTDTAPVTQENTLELQGQEPVLTADSCYRAS